MRTALLIGLAMAGVALTVITAVNLQTGLASIPAGGEPDLGPVIADAVWIACGLLASWKRPHNAVGPLVLALGFVDMISLTSWNEALPSTVVGLVSAFVLPLVVHLFLAFPSGRLTTRPQRVLVGFGYGAAAVLGPLGAITSGPATDCSACAPSLLRVEGAQTAADAVSLVASVLIVVVLATAIAMTVARWRWATGATRRALGPVVVLAAIETATLVAVAVLEQLGLDEPSRWVANLGGIIYVAIPIVFAVGLLRTRLHRGAVADLVLELEAHPGAPQLRDAVARALGDPSLEVGFWLPDEHRYVTADGQPLEPADGAGQAASAMTTIERDGARLAVLVHDPGVDGGLVKAVGAAASLAIANARLQAALVAQLAEVRASRTRIVQAGDLERRRIERDLHDGAQQRLLGVRLALRLARSRLEDGNVGAATEVLGEADAAVVDAIEELRALARGIHPPILTEEGLGPALSALAGRAPVPIDLSVDPGRLPPAVEATCYFVAAEATANIVKHATATRARIDVDVSDGIVTLVVADDGIGGADVEGAGLRGLRDRVEAVAGRFQVDSPAVGGTRVSAWIPCG
jgi:signal transduction histidine kinase